MSELTEAEVEQMRLSTLAAERLRGARACPECGHPSTDHVGFFGHQGEPMPGGVCLGRYPERCECRLTPADIGIPPGAAETLTALRTRLNHWADSLDAEAEQYRTRAGEVNAEAYKWLQTGRAEVCERIARQLRQEVTDSE